MRGEEHVREWLDNLKDVVYYADDLLDEVNTEALRVKVEGETQEEHGHQVNDHISSLSAKFPGEIMPKINDTVEEFECFVQQIDLLGLQKGSVGYHQLLWLVNQLWLEGIMK